MKNLSLFLLALAAGLPALAQVPALTLSNGDSSVTLYGVLDVGVGRVNHSLGFDPYNAAEISITPNKVIPTAATGMFNGGISPSRWGLKGGTKIAEGYRAIFLLESGFNLPSGNLSNGALGVAQTPATAAAPFNSGDSALSGQLFGRGAYLGVESQTYGTLTLGRQQSFMLDLLPAYDVLQGAQIFTPIGYSGSYGGGGATDNSRVDYSVKYKVKVGNLNVGLLHKFGGVTNNANAKSAEQFNVGYESGPFGVQFVYQGFKDATSLSYNGTAATSTVVTTPTGTTTITVPANPNAVKATFFDTVSYMLLAKYQFRAWGFKGGYQKQKFTNPSDPSQDAKLTSIFGDPVTATSLTPYTGTEKDLTLSYVGIGYDLTPQFNVAVAYYQVTQNNFQNAANAFAAADASGKSKFDSVLLDYRFTKQFDTYLGYVANVVSGGLAAGYPLPNNSTVGLGARLAF